MQIIILLVELFMPEIAQQLAGKDSGSLRKRLFRSGMSLSVLALLIFVWSLFDHLVTHNLPLGQFDPFDLSIFTAWLLIMTGMGLLVLSRHENPKISNEANNPSEQFASNEVLSSLYNAQTPLNVHQGVIKTKTIGLQDCLNGVVPNEEWEFFVGDQYCKVVNNSVAGSRLYVANLLVTQDRSKMRFGLHKQPSLHAKITDSSGKEHELAVYFRAWLHIKIRVTVDGKYLSERFV